MMREIWRRSAKRLQFDMVVPLPCSQADGSARDETDRQTDKRQPDQSPA
jgi:hypothetical protein